MLTSGLITKQKDYCCIFVCHDSRGRVGKFGKKVTLNKDPIEMYTQKAWIGSVSRKNWKQSSRVCSDHFKDGAE